MNIHIILIVVIVLLLFGGLAPWGGYSNTAHGYGFGPYVPSGLGVVLVLLIAFLLLR